MASAKLIRRLFAAIIAVPAWIVAGMTLQANAREAGGRIIGGLVTCTLYLSDWSIFLTCLVFSAVTLNPDFKRSWWWIGQVVIADASMLIGYWGVVTWQMFYHESTVLHYTHGLAPILVAVYWLFLVDHERLVLKDVLLWLIPPLAYTFGVEVFGLFTGRYPYHQLNPFFQGRLNVLFSVAAILFLCMLTSLAMLALDKHLLPLRPTTSRRGKAGATIPVIEKESATAPPPAPPLPPSLPRSSRARPARSA